ncbi:MAG: hypothetical protein HDR89_07515 [Bacteroides sp.]|nr:hypothetical protein [Bacteroides sp.]
MITLVILTIAAFVLLTTLFETLFGLPDDLSAIISGSILGALTIVWILVRPLLRRGRDRDGVQRVIRIHNGRIIEEYNEEWEERNRKFCSRRDKEISREVERGYSLDSLYRPWKSSASDSCRGQTFH